MDQNSTVSSDSPVLNALSNLITGIAQKPADPNAKKATDLTANGQIPQMPGPAMSPMEGFLHLFNIFSAGHEAGSGGGQSAAGQPAGQDVKQKADAASQTQDGKKSKSSPAESFMSILKLLGM